MAEQEQEVLDAKVPVVTTTIVEYSEAAAGIAEMQHRLKDRAYNLATTAGDKEARADRKALVTARTSLDTRRKALNEADQKRISDRNAEAKRLTGLVIALEDPIDAQIKADEKRREEERAAVVRKEAERVSGIQARIDQMRQYAVDAPGMHSSTIAMMLTDLEEIVVDESFDEFAPIAAMAKDQTLSNLRSLRERALQTEATQRELEEKRAELERLQEAERARKAAEEAARLAEQARVAEQQRGEAQRLADERAALVRQQEAATANQRRLDQEAADRRTEEDRKAKAERERADKEARDRRDAEEIAANVKRAAAQKEIDNAAAAQRRREEEAAAAAVEAARLERERKEASLQRLHAAAPRMYDVMLNLRTLTSGQSAPRLLVDEAVALVDEIGERTW